MAFANSLAGSDNFTSNALAIAFSDTRDDYLLLGAGLYMSILLGFPLHTVFVGERGEIPKLELLLLNALGPVG